MPSRKTRQVRCLSDFIIMWCPECRCGSHLPNKPKREASIQRARVVIVIECGRKVLLTQQKEGCQRRPLNFSSPSGIHQETMRAHSCRSKRNPTSPPRTHWANPTPLTHIRHSITRYRYTLYCFRVKVPKAFEPNAEYQWVSRSELSQCAMPSAHNQLRGLIASTTRAKKSKKGIT